jgi:hypothetical protein
VDINVDINDNGKRKDWAKRKNERLSKREAKRWERTLFWKEQRKRQRQSPEGLAAKQRLAVERAFWELCRGLAQEDFAALMNMDDLRMKVYLYNHPKREAFHPEDNQIHWTVMHYLRAKSRKHIYMTGRIPKIDRYNHQIAVMISRIKWIARQYKEKSR